jgi:demethylmenaquinone methyltransferase/2-methoxy-6-polyprenyl-1,4-benzoquinol methylase
MPDKTPIYISGFYDGIFRHYETINSFLTLGLDKLWRREAARLALASAPERVLDVCCGTGDLSADLFRLSSGGTAVTGLDFNEAMLSKAVRKVPGAVFIRGDAGRLPFPDNTFDALTISFAARNLGHGDGLLKYFEEFRRVLKPGGVLVNLETSRPAGRLILFLFHTYVRLMTGLVNLAFPGTKAAYSFLRETIAAFHSQEELSKLLLAAGFSKVKALPLFFGAAAIHTAEK